MTNATMRDSRHTSARSRSEPGEWSDYAIVGSPVAFGSAPSAKEDFRDLAISASVHSGIERTQSKRKPAPTRRGAESKVE